MKDVKQMTIQELADLVSNVYDVSEEIFRRTGYLKYWAAIDCDYQMPDTAFDLAYTIATKPAGNEEDNHKLVMEKFTELFHQVGIDLAGVDEDEYWDNPDVPLWENDE